MNMHVLSVMILAMVAAGGIVHVFIYPYLSGDIKAEKRQSAVRSAAAKRSAERVIDAATRRKLVADSLKEIEERGKRKRLSLETRMAQVY